MRHWPNRLARHINTSELCVDAASQFPNKFHLICRTAEGWESLASSFTCTEYRFFDAQKMLRVCGKHRHGLLCYYLKERNSTHTCMQSSSCKLFVTVIPGKGHDCCKKIM